MQKVTYTVTTRTSHGSYTKQVGAYSVEQALAIHAAQLCHLGVKHQHCMLA